jgi:hypothetical protein
MSLQTNSRQQLAVSRQQPRCASVFAAPMPMG